MRYLFLLLQLFFIFSVTEFVGALSSASYGGKSYGNDFDDLFNDKTFLSNELNKLNYAGNDYRESKFSKDYQNNGNSYGSRNTIYDASPIPDNDGYGSRNTIYNASPILDNAGRTYNPNDILAPVQPVINTNAAINTNYDKDLQSLLNSLTSGEKLDPGLFDNNVDSSVISASDEDNLVRIKELYRKYQDLMNDPELQRKTQESSPDFYLQTLKKIKEDFQITGYNLYRFLRNNSPIRNKYKKKIDKYFGQINGLLDVLNLIIRHREYPSLYLATDNPMPFDNIWGTSVVGNGTTITVAAVPNISAATVPGAQDAGNAANSGPSNNNAQDAGNAADSGPSNNNAHNAGSAANPDPNNNNAQGAEDEESENNEENNESDQNGNSDTGVNDSNEGSQFPVVGIDDEDEEDAAESVHLSGDRINGSRIDDDDDDDWLSTGGIIGGAAVAGGAGLLMLDSDPIQSEYDDYYGQSAKNQAKNRVTSDSVKSNDDATALSDDLYEDENSPADNRTESQKAEKTAAKNKSDQEDVGEEEDDSDDGSSKKSPAVDSAAVQKGVTDKDSDTESIADSGYDSSDDSDEDDEISDRPTDQTSQSSRIVSQTRRDQLSGSRSGQRNFEQNDEFATNSEKSGVSGGVFDQVFASRSRNYIVPTQSGGRQIFDQQDNQYVYDSSIEDYIRGSDSSIEDYISGEANSYYWNENDQYSASSSDFYGKYQSVPTKNDRLLRFVPLDDELHAGDF